MDSSFGPWDGPQFHLKISRIYALLPFTERKSLLQARTERRRKKKVRDLESGERKVEEKFAQDTEREIEKTREEKRRDLSLFSSAGSSDLQLLTVSDLVCYRTKTQTQNQSFDFFCYCFCDLQEKRQLAT